MKIIGWLKNKKSYIVGSGAILTAIGACLSGTIDVTTMIEAIFAGVALMTLRAGIAKVNE